MTCHSASEICIVIPPKSTFVNYNYQYTLKIYICQPKNHIFKIYRRYKYFLSQQ